MFTLEIELSALFEQITKVLLFETLNGPLYKNLTGNLIEN